MYIIKEVKQDVLGVYVQWCIRFEVLLNECEDSSQSSWHTNCISVESLWENQSNKRESLLVEVFIVVRNRRDVGMVRPEQVGTWSSFGGRSGRPVGRGG